MHLVNSSGNVIDLCNSELHTKFLILLVNICVNFLFPFFNQHFYCYFIGKLLPYISRTDICPLCVSSIYHSIM